MKASDYEAMLRNASQSTKRLNPDMPAGNSRQTPKLEHGTRLQVSAPASTQSQDQSRYVVRFVSYRRRPLDDENACTKWYTDALQSAGIIQSDNPAQCLVSVEPVTIAKGEQERVEIEVWKLI